MISAFKVPEANFELLRDNNNGSGLDVTFIDQSINVVEWLWYFGDFETATNKNPSHNYSEAGDYKVMLIGKNADGCYDTTIGHISVSKHLIGNNIYTPTAFSPNGDGINDEFKPVIAGDENQPYEMTIYDRNGLVVFETNDINKGWDGKIGEGELAPFGTYVWLVIVKDDGGTEHKRLGQVTLLK
jgi:gliding motility-associated-like protein